jgi:hypothetical protein
MIQLINYRCVSTIKTESYLFRKKCRDAQINISATNLLIYKYLLQLIYNLTAARQSDVADFVSDFLHVFHLFEFE